MQRNLMAFACTMALAVTGCSDAKSSGTVGENVSDSEYPTQVFWGDTHLHTDNSGDAFGFGNRLNSEAALRFARGEEVVATKGAKAKLARPLDFLVIADHAGAMGATKEIADTPRAELLGDELRLKWHDMFNDEDPGSNAGLRATAEIIDRAGKGTLPDGLLDPETSKRRTTGLWAKHGQIVEQYNEPGKFTAFMGFEFTPGPGGDNLHRVVMFRDAPAEMGDTLPFSAFGRRDPEMLWAYMDAYEQKTGGKVLAIPHNSNISDGRMFAMNKFDGSPLDETYVKTRAMREPIVEVTQIKGDSEAHPFLSPNDEFASFGNTGWDRCNLICAKDTPPETYGGSYIREALKRGLELTVKFGTNPFQLGMIGSTDSHTSLATADEDNFFGKHSGLEFNNAKRASTVSLLGGRKGRIGWHYLSSGYAAVWATSNTREAIFDAMMRREVYATTGPRMQLRFFGGFDFAEGDTGDLVKTGYAKGVPMGGELVDKNGGETKAPSFLVSALMDPDNASLDRIQIIKGWIDTKGETHEKVYNVSWSNAETRTMDSDGKVTPASNNVDLTNGTWDNSSGEPELTTWWQDPDFDAAQNAFYYARVLEIPTPTWPVYDALIHNIELPDDVIMIQQERAYSSPIWYRPKA
ncbi:MAG: DUF3604 domain-containing protein [Parasphingorhabdus sp.]|uniref:DUF3604 domain-containing protein n=1 Tax=Parasphingorhabdus sp. TaxID=2709688 RepID=UPI0032998DE7